MVVQFDQVMFLKQTHHVTAVKIVITRFKRNTCNCPFTTLIESEPSVPFCPMQILIMITSNREDTITVPCFRLQVATQFQLISSI